MGDSSINSDPATESGVPDTVVNDATAYVRKTGGVLSEAALHLEFCTCCVTCMMEHGSDWMAVT